MKSNNESPAKDRGSEMTNKWKFQFSENDVRSIIRAFDHLIGEVEPVGASHFRIDYLAIREARAQWQRIRNEFSIQVGEEVK